MGQFALRRVKQLSRGKANPPRPMLGCFAPFVTGRGKADKTLQDERGADELSRFRFQIRIPAKAP
jgi:hypothetical protein